MNLALHSTGASFVAGKSAHNPRDLVVTVLEKAPDAEREEQFQQFRQLLAKRADAFQRAVDWYFFLNMSTYLTTNRNVRPDPVQRAESVAIQQEMVESIKAQIVMLDLTMPNGKPMKECTGAEMSRFGNRFQRIAEKVGKTKTVGAVLNEDQVKAIMK
jgi:hypothetical protein